MISSGLPSYALAGGFRTRCVTEPDLRVVKLMAQPGGFSNRAVFSRLHHDGVVLLLSIAAHQTSVQHQAPLDPLPDELVAGAVIQFSITDQLLRSYLVRRF
jgi:hypothetical protein